MHPDPCLSQGPGRLTVHRTEAEPALRTRRTFTQPPVVGIGPTVQQPPGAFRPSRLGPRKGSNVPARGRRQQPLQSTICLGPTPVHPRPASCSLSRCMDRGSARLAAALQRGCCTKASEKRWNLTGGRRIAIHRFHEVLVPLAGHLRLAVSTGRPITDRRTGSVGGLFDSLQPRGRSMRRERQLRERDGDQAMRSGAVASCSPGRCAPARGCRDSRTASGHRSRWRATTVLRYTCAGADAARSSCRAMERVRRPLVETSIAWSQRQARRPCCCPTPAAAAATRSRGRGERAGTRARFRRRRGRCRRSAGPCR
jgi:hypothetical protein